MFMWSALTALRTLRKATPAVLTELINGEEVLRNGMAYAYEIGAGAPLIDEVVSSINNPFLNVNWRTMVGLGQEEL